MSESPKLILEVEVENFNTEGLVEGLTEFGGEVSVLDYLYDADILRPDCVLAVSVPTGGVTVAAQQGHIVGARLSE